MTSFWDTKLGNRLSVQAKARAKEFDAETRTIERQVKLPWPEIGDVYDVTVRSAYETGCVVIYVSDQNFEVWTRVRTEQDALAEIVGFWARASSGLRIEPSTPESVREYLESLMERES
jgi:hypothetical protein